MKIHLLEGNQNFRRVFCLVVFGMARIGNEKSARFYGESWKSLESAFRGRLHELADFSSLFLHSSGSLTENGKLLQQSDSLMFFIRRWTTNFPFSKCHEAVSMFISMDTLLSGASRSWRVFSFSICCFHSCHFQTGLLRVHQVRALHERSHDSNTPAVSAFSLASSHPLHHF